MKNSLRLTAVKIIALCSLFFIALPFWSLGQSKEKEEAERQMAQKLVTLLSPNFPTLSPCKGLKRYYYKPQLEIKARRGVFYKNTNTYKSVIYALKTIQTYFKTNF